MSEREGKVLLTIIIVDDEKGIVDLIRRLIDPELVPAQVVGEALDGADAYQQIVEKRPDVVITDIRMPGLNGLDLIGRVRESGLAVDFVIISGYRDFEYAQNALKYGVVDYLLKPIRKQDLQELLNKLDEKRGSAAGLKTRISHMEEELAVNHDILRKNAVRNLVSGEPERLEQAFQTLAANGVFRLVEGFYGAAVMKLDCSTDREYRFPEETTSAMADKFVRWMRPNCRDLECAVFGSAAHILFHYGRDQISLKERCAGLRRLLREGEGRCGLFDVTIGVGMETDELHRLPEAFSTARRALAARVDLGTGQVIAYEELTPRYLRPYEGLSPQDFTRLERLVMNLDPEEMEEEVNGLISQTAGPECCYYRVNELSRELIGFVGRKLEERMPDCQVPDWRPAAEAVDDCIHGHQFKLACMDYIGRAFRECARQQADLSSRPVRQIKQYVKEHYREDISLEDLARLVFLNPTYVSAVFRKETGRTLTSYLIEVRMEKARELLRESALTVNEIAGAVGYQDPRHFSKLFAKTVGVKPVEYRKFYS